MSSKSMSHEAKLWTKHGSLSWTKKASMPFKWKTANEVNILKWVTQSPEFDPMEHLWTELKKQVYAWRPTNLTQLHEFCQKERANIPAEHCINIDSSYTMSPKY